MRLSESEVKQVHIQFGNSPLLSHWREWPWSLAPRLEMRIFAPGQLIFRPGDVPTYLYLIVEGTVEESVSRGSLSGFDASLAGIPPVWLRKRSTAGRFVGHQALFLGAYQSTAVATTATTLCLMSTISLALSMEQNPFLYDILRPEECAKWIPAASLWYTN